MAESVYISSTFNDLKNFRQAIIDCLGHMNDYYKVVSMEFYDAEYVNFVKKCTDDVIACDIYILILESVMVINHWVLISQLQK